MNANHARRTAAVMLWLGLAALAGAGSSQAQKQASTAAQRQAPQVLDRSLAPERWLASDDEEAVEAEALDELERFVKAVEERVRHLTETSREERKDKAVEAAREMIAKAKDDVHVAKRRISALETAAGSKAERVKERALRFLGDLLGRLDRAESLL